MIVKLDVQGFKRFNRETFNFKPLTLLTGLNGAGKSSLIQTLLLAKSASNTVSRKTLSLNNTYTLQLGNCEDITNWQSSGDINIKLHDDAKNTLSLSLTTDNEQALFLNIKSIDNKTNSDAFNGNHKGFSYLSAERIGPRKMFELTSEPSEQLNVGIQGENCAQILADLGNQPIQEKNRIHPNTNHEAHFLTYQLEKWLSEIARPIQIEATSGSRPPVATMRFKTLDGEWVNATNMGFGVSYALPIVLAGLTTKNGGMVIVENPEAHLHPAGQSRMGVFLAWLANQGVQVIVETHSDHVLNGIRRAIAEFKYLEHNQAHVIFFELANNDHFSHQELTFNENASLSAWPSAFFDQYQLDIAALGRNRRSRR